jgi:hypothetical protein
MPKTNMKPAKRCQPLAEAWRTRLPVAQQLVVHRADREPEYDLLFVLGQFPAQQGEGPPGVYDANADSLKITIYGKGGHGASPQSTIDPIVIAARTLRRIRSTSGKSRSKPEPPLQVTTFFTGHPKLISTASKPKSWQ